MKSRVLRFLDLPIQYPFTTPWVKSFTLSCLDWQNGKNNQSSGGLSEFGYPLSYMMAEEMTLRTSWNRQQSRNTLGSSDIINWINFNPTLLPNKNGCFAYCNHRWYLTTASNNSLYYLFASWHIGVSYLIITAWRTQASASPGRLWWPLLDR